MERYDNFQAARPYLSHLDIERAHVGQRAEDVLLLIKQHELTVPLSVPVRDETSAFQFALPRSRAKASPSAAGKIRT